ncbi:MULTISPECIES: hypothetical protein [unclassified Microcoleus]|uniref:hypothetical protein n=1 Tax=unclassified Microcoleus TaxID=2642155 RepID=UPI002FD2319A
MIKIIQKTDHLLKLENEISWLIPAVSVTGFSGILLSIILITMSSSGVERLSCKIIEPKFASCEISTSSFMGLVKGELKSIEQVKEAKFETIDSTHSEGYSTSVDNVFLVTNQGNVPLSYQTAKDAELFNKYIQSSVGKFVIEKDNRLSKLGSIIVQSCFIVLGFAVIYFLFHDLFSVKTYIFDKNKRSLTIKQRGIMVNEKREIRINEVTEKSLSEISEVELKTVYVHKTEHMSQYGSVKAQIVVN